MALARVFLAYPSLALIPMSTLDPTFNALVSAFIGLKGPESRCQKRARLS
jgi:hypothetical protein